ncbi:MAG TPA: hypothetical protein VK204_16845 [Nocardioidaceae bacterium]|nr:hypothetical protein [Nocardioidaceae bacterium]
MNEPTIRLEVRPEVSAFVDQVRARLSDLSDEDREELLGGLEADIAELVSDGGSVAELGDPRAYADELRAAAGITGCADGRGRGSLRERSTSRPVDERLTSVLDGSRRQWIELAETPALRGVWSFVVAIRPLWWVIRAWVAVQLVDMRASTDYWAKPVPSLGGPVVGTVLLAVAIVLSVQMGRGRLWPRSGPVRPVVSRVVLVVLNGFALLMVPVVLGNFPSYGVWEYRDILGGELPDVTPGLVSDGQAVANVFPYDAQGNPLTGVQLFDQDGNPLNVARFAGDDFNERTGKRVVTYPWLNGGRRLYNVFPLPRRDQRSDFGGVRADAWTTANPPYLPTPPLAVVPPATLPTPAAPEPTDAAADEDRERR